LLRNKVLRLPIPYRRYESTSFERNWTDFLDTVCTCRHGAESFYVHTMI
jgi:hypothetical protein